MNIPMPAIFIRYDAANCPRGGLARVILDNIDDCACRVNAFGVGVPN
jgi:hypothetical protein